MLSLTPEFLRVSPRLTTPPFCSSCQPPRLTYKERLSHLHLPSSCCLHLQFGCPMVFFSNANTIVLRFQKMKDEKEGKIEKGKICPLAWGSGVVCGGGVCAWPTSLNLPSKLCDFLAQCPWKTHLTSQFLYFLI